MSYDFADRLIEMRRSRSLSQEELAKQLGLSRQAVSKWERAESAPDIGNLVALADIYGVSLDELVRGMENAEDAEGDSTEEVIVDASPAANVSGNASVASGIPNETTSTTVVEEATCEPTPPPSGTPVDPTPFGPTAQTVSAPPPNGAPVSIEPTVSQPSAQKKPRNPLFTFPYPLLVVLVYLFLGFFFGLWHPGWVLFLTIPFYYWIASVITHDPEYIARHQTPQD